MVTGLQGSIMECHSEGIIVAQGRNIPETWVSREYNYICSLATLQVSVLLAKHTYPGLLSTMDPLSSPIWVMITNLEIYLDCTLLDPSHTPWTSGSHPAASYMDSDIQVNIYFNTTAMDSFIGPLGIFIEIWSPCSMINETESKHSLVLLLENIWEFHCQIPETYYVYLQSAFIIEDGGGGPFCWK